MLTGKIDKFAVNWEICEVVDGWVFGRFYLLINGFVVGDQNDHSVDLKGCLRWLKNFFADTQNRYEPDLYGMPKDQVFLRLASAVLANEDQHRFASEIYEDTFTRFHLSHIGMSSFDNVILLLVKSEQGNERCVWKVSNGEVMDAYLEVGEIEGVFSELVKILDDSISFREAD